MNKHEIERIAAAMNQLRPDWPVKSLHTLLSKPQLVNRARRDVTVALAWVACEKDTATPARVLEAGPWWKAAGVEGTLVSRHPHPEDACGTCGRERCTDHPRTRRLSDAEQTEQARHARELLAHRLPQPEPDLRRVLPAPGDVTTRTGGHREGGSA